MNIAVIGCGSVGLVTAACFAELGHIVVAAESDTSRLRLLQKGLSPVNEQHLPELLQKHTGTRLHFRRSIAETVQQAQAVFICVGTPSLRSGQADLSGVDAAVREISRCVRSYLLVVEKSTVPARTCKAIRRTMISSGVSPELFSVASNPEFLREGTAVCDFLYPHRIVFGATDQPSLLLLRRAYRTLTSGEYHGRCDRIPGNCTNDVRVIETTPESAELIKHASNAFLAMKISFINAVATIAESVDADICDVRAGLGSDPRIGPAFLDAGIGFGGSCFPKDLYAFRALAEQSDYRFDLLSEVIQINEGQRIRFVEKVRSALSPLAGKHVAVLGLSFKEGTDDIRKSPAIEIVQRLTQDGATVTAFDPAAMVRARQELPEPAVRFAGDPYEAMTDANALLILTQWPDFAALDLDRVRNLLRSPTVLDGRNLYSLSQMESAGFDYISVGRPPIRAGSKQTDKIPLTAPAEDDNWTRHTESSLGATT